MAEMTAKRATELLRCITEYKGKWCCVLLEDNADEIAAIIQQQAQTIAHQNLQIAKLQEDLIKAISEKE